MNLGHLSNSLDFFLHAIMHVLLVGSGLILFCNTPSLKCNFYGLIVFFEKYKVVKPIHLKTFKVNYLISTSHVLE